MRIAVLTTVFIGEYGVTRVLENQLKYLVADRHCVDLLPATLIGAWCHAVCMR